MGEVHEAQEVFDALVSVENGRHEFAGRLARVAADGAIALGFPSAPLEGGSVQRQGGLGVDADVDRLTAMVVADLDAGGGGDAGFQFNPPADLAGEVILALLQFHEVQWVRMSLTL